jgi:hypothetical protein
MKPYLNTDLFLILTVIVALLALLMPLVMYLTSGWVLRRREILTSFTGKAILRYFETFSQTDYETFLHVEKQLKKEQEKKINAESGAKAESLQDEKHSHTEQKKKPKPTPENVGAGQEEDEESYSPESIKKMRDKFESYFSTSFGRSKFLLPGLLLMGITAFFLIFFSCLMRPYFEALIGSGTMPLVKWYCFGALAGFMGGYMWVLYFFMKRMQERKLSPSDLYWCSSRLILAVPIALAFAALFKGPLNNQALYALCFMLGAFPLQSLMTFMRRTASSKLNLQDSFDDAVTDLTQLQSLGRNQAEIYNQEGVGTILQLAYSDPVDLTIRTGFSFSYVIDCCSQALAWLSFENNLSVLRKYGLRGAQEITTFVFELSENKDQDQDITMAEKAWAEKTLEIVSVELNIDKVSLRGILDSIAYDPYSQFLYDIWQADWN